MEITNRKNSYVIEMPDARFIYRKTKRGQEMVLEELNFYRESAIQLQDAEMVGLLDGAIAFIEMEMAGTSTAVN